MRPQTLLRAVPALLLALVACSDEPTRPRVPTTGPDLSTSAAVPSGNAVIVFKDESGIPQAGLDLVQSLGGVVTTRLDGIGVLFATSLTTAALDVLRGNDLVRDVGPDYRLNWLADDRIGRTL